MQIRGQETKGGKRRRSERHATPCRRRRVDTRLGWIGFNGGSVTTFKTLTDGAQLVVGQYMQYTILAAGSGAAATYIIAVCQLHFARRRRSDPGADPTDQERTVEQEIKARAVLSGAMTGMVYCMCWSLASTCSTPF